VAVTLSTRCAAGERTTHHSCAGKEKIKEEIQKIIRSPSPSCADTIEEKTSKVKPNILNRGINRRKNLKNEEGPMSGEK